MGKVIGLAAIVACLAISQSASAQSQPSPQQAAAVFQNAYRQKVGRQVVFVVDTFQKTNGQSRPGEYLMWYRAVVRFPRGIRPECVPANPNQFTGFNCGPPGFGPRPQRPGATEVIDGQMAFSLTERGWVAVSSGLPLY